MIIYVILFVYSTFGISNDNRHHRTNNILEKSFFRLLNNRYRGEKKHVPILEMFLFERASLLVYSNTEDSTFFRMTFKNKRDSDISFLSK